MLRKPSGQPTDRVAGVPGITDLVGLKFPEYGKIHGFTVTESLEALFRGYCVEQSKKIVFVCPYIRDYVRNEIDTDPRSGPLFGTFVKAR